MLDPDKIKNKGGRPPHNQVRDRIITIMKDLRGARMSHVFSAYNKVYKNKPVSYNTIKKYMSALADDKILKATTVFDNVTKVRKKESSQHRVVNFFEFNLDNG